LPLQLGVLLGLDRRRLGLGHLGDGLGHLGDGGWLRWRLLRLRLPGGQRRLLRGCRLTGDRLLELTHPASKRAADLRKSLGSEHEQQDHDEERDVKWVVQSHVHIAV